MTSGTNSSGSCFSSKKNSKIDDNYLRELNEDLQLRKQELLEMLKPLEDKNTLLFQKLMGNLEEKQRSLQIMRQIMSGKGCDESSVMELIKEAEDMKQNLEKKNKMLRKEMEMLWNKTFESQELQDQQKALPTKPKADLKDGKVSSEIPFMKAKSELEISDAEEVEDMRRLGAQPEKQQRKIEWVKYEEHPNILQNGFHGKVIELRIESLRNYQKANDLKLSLYLQHNFEPKQGVFNLLRPQGKMGTTMERATTNRNETNMSIPRSKNCTEQQEGSRESQSDDVGERLFFLRSMSDEALKD
ncbi:putative coiled-coil domain-containing protein 196 [Cricetulus griseus]|uniref:Coiled-coil domain-containing protein 196 n=1 Tax=Cricetulus griseus TaxID=10029 RepID=A0A9J7G2M4_CRIGR|nr:putative coiled-coil domain-containing protein 196 [Cricetulus griseus]XP_027291935.1 putative coiled-coil domain-containing protein 196 [Cricetulus griseus]